jgi:hypothetical protein
MPGEITGWLLFLSTTGGIKREGGPVGGTVVDDGVPIEGAEITVVSGGGGDGSGRETAGSGMASNASGPASLRGLASASDMIAACSGGGKSQGRGTWRGIEYFKINAKFLSYQRRRHDPIYW